MKRVLPPAVVSIGLVLACGPRWPRKVVDAAPIAEGSGGSSEGSGGAGGSRGGGTGGGLSVGQGGPPDAAVAWDGPGAGVGGGFDSGVRDAGPAAEPCAPAKDVSCAGGGGTTNIDPPKTCFRTADLITHWGCGNPTGWSVKVNGRPVRCGDSAQTLPFPVNGLLYFELTGNEQAMPTNIWWQGICKAGPYPPWPGTGAGTPTDASAD